MTLYIVGNQHAWRLRVLGRMAVLGSRLHFVVWTYGSTSIMSVVLEAVMKKHGGCRRVGAWQ